MRFFIALLLLIATVCGADARNSLLEIENAAFTSFSLSKSITATLFPAMGSQASSVYPWATYPPGVTYNGGIPARTTLCATLSPSGGDDSPQIQSAVDACPAGQTVKLTAGVFQMNDTINIKASDQITIRGVGPGPGGVVPTNQTSIPSPACASGGTCTVLFRVGWPAGYDMIDVNAFGDDFTRLTTVADLTSDGTQGSTVLHVSSTTGFTVGRLAVIDVVTFDSTATDWSRGSIWPTSANPEIKLTQAFQNNGSVCTPSCGPIAGLPFIGDYGYSRPYRRLHQILKVTAVNSGALTVTIESPLAVNYAVANGAQLMPVPDQIGQGNLGISHQVGIEDLLVYGAGYLNSSGNINIAMCDRCWIKHVESTWAFGPGMTLRQCYRCEIRDSYTHEATRGVNTTNGGLDYLMAIDVGTSNSLIENNTMWNGDKVIVMRAAGGGNVVAYNYMDDTFDGGVGGYGTPEAGINSGHMLSTNFTLFEGNWSHRMSGDDWWGNSIYTTAFRNQFSGLRSAHSWLHALDLGGSNQYWGDCGGRAAVVIQANNLWYNIVGNVLGFSGQSLFTTPQPSCYQNVGGFRYERISWPSTPSGGACCDGNYVDMWELGQPQDTGISPTDTWGIPPDNNAYQKTNRQGNFDFVTNSQIWYSTYGGSGTTSTGPSQSLPNSLYLSGTPAFFASNTWPWIDPSSGTTYTLPAKARYDNGTPNTLP